MHGVNTFTKLEKNYVELLAYDEQRRHYADKRITLDLDDGVKVNFGKFGDLLAEVKHVRVGWGMSKNLDITPISMGR